MTSESPGSPPEPVSPGEGEAFEFPCRMGVKAMGKATPEFCDVVCEIVKRHALVDPNLVREKASGKGNYQSITVVVDVDSREQLEAIYRDLTECDAVSWTL